VVQLGGKIGDTPMVAGSFGNECFQHQDRGRLGGGDPADGADTGHVPEFQPLEAGGTNYFEYVYARCNDAAERGLDAEFDSVTNRVPVAGTQEFIRLRIGY
jgi:hypothetical protein